MVLCDIPANGKFTLGGRLKFKDVIAGDPKSVCALSRRDIWKGNM